MTSAFKEREWLKKAYPGPKWAEKVNKMTDGQVLAAYLRLQQNPKKISRRTK